MPDKSLSKLGGRVLTQLGDGPSHEEVMAQRQRFLLAAEHQRATPWRFAFAGIGMAFAATALVFGIYSALEGGTIPFWIDADETPGIEGQWVEAGEARPVSIRFEGGSVFVLDKNAAARVVTAKHKKVVVDLSKGHVRCRVHGNGETGWVVRAGTYRVRVTGTEFSVDWDPGAAQLDVGVDYGSVLVFGAALGEHGVKLSGGDHLSVGGARTTIAKNKMIEEDRGEETEEEEQGGQDLVQTPPSNAERERSRPARPRPYKHTPKELGWRELYAEKDYNKVVDLITDQGLEQFIAGAGSKDLWRVGKAARYTRRGDVAHRVLEGLVDRFPGTKDAQNATFVLGRVAMELQKNPRAAQKWFTQYLSQSPRGPLAEEALGRLIDVCRQTGQNAAARKHAERYLSRYPTGPYAQLAESVASRR